MAEFSHLDKSGRLTMVDISNKTRCLRTAVARGRITLQPSTIAALNDHHIPKGDVLTCARLAAIQAAKNTSALIPLCHPIALSWVDVQFSVAQHFIDITVTTRSNDATGVEMEALSGVSVAALTIYDMCKAVDKSMTISDINLVEKTKALTASQ